MVCTLPGKEVVNAYGPTEASDDICHYKMSAIPVNSIVPNRASDTKYKDIYIKSLPGIVSCRSSRGVVCKWSRRWPGLLERCAKDIREICCAIFLIRKARGGCVPGDLARWLPDGNMVLSGE